MARSTVTRCPGENPAGRRTFMDRRPSRGEGVRSFSASTSTSTLRPAVGSPRQKDGRGVVVRAGGDGGGEDVQGRRSSIFSPDHRGGLVKQQLVIADAGLTSHTSQGFQGGLHDCLRLLPPLKKSSSWPSAMGGPPDPMVGRSWAA